MYNFTSATRLGMNAEGRSFDKLSTKHLLAVSSKLELFLVLVLVLVLVLQLGHRVAWQHARLA